MRGDDWIRNMCEKIAGSLQIFLFIYLTDLRNALFTSTLFPFESCNIKNNNLIHIVDDQQLYTHMQYCTVYRAYDLSFC
jgi:hypothetical protein